LFHPKTALLNLQCTKFKFLDIKLLKKTLTETKKKKKEKRIEREIDDEKRESTRNPREIFCGWILSIRVLSLDRYYFLTVVLRGGALLCHVFNLNQPK